MIPKEYLRQRYTQKGKSMQQIASELKCSVHRVTYWMQAHGIERRKMSDAIYAWHNPNGDPFKLNMPKTTEDSKLLGIGLYWGEGTKTNLNSIRLGNTDPKLLTTFIRFLVKILGIKKRDLRFGLQIFSDIDPEEALDFWVKSLKVNKSQFQKVVVTLSGSIGTYRRKSKYGVVTVQFHNKKARDVLMSLMPM